MGREVSERLVRLAADGRSSHVILVSFSRGDVINRRSNGAAMSSSLIESADSKHRRCKRFSNSSCSLDISARSVQDVVRDKVSAFGCERWSIELKQLWQSFGKLTLRSPVDELQQARNSDMGNEPRSTTASSPALPKQP